MKTLITGSSGLVGSALVESLFQKGHSIKCLQRNKTSEHNSFWSTQDFEVTHKTSFNTIIHLAGENVAQGRWTAAKKHSIMHSRVEGTRALIDYISQLTPLPEVFLCASAVGYYGNRGDEILDESSNSGEGFLAEVCKQWESETQRLTKMGVRVINLRFGMVISPKGGALHKMIPPFKARLGGVIGSGSQFISWISITDLVDIVSFIIDNKNIKGAVNIVSPEPTTNRKLTFSLGKVLNRPTFFRIPSLLARIVFGQMADEMLLCSTRAIPRILDKEGYEFRDTSLESYLQFCTDTL